MNRAVVKMKRQLYLPLVLTLLVSLVFGALPQPAYADPGWLSGWDKRVKLTIDQNDIDAALSDFPILVYLSTSSGRNSDDVSFVFDELTSDDNRKKIAVTESDGTTELYVEIEKWDDANEHAWLWVKVPDIASGADTDLYLYYDKDHADNDSYVGDTNSTPAENVWDSNYKAVWHLDEDAAGIVTDDLYQDSTSNNYHGDDRVSDTGKTGKIGRGQDFDGDDDYIDTGTNILPGGANPFTVSLWYKWPYNGSVEEKGDAFSEVTASKDGLFDWQGENKDDPLIKVKWIVYSWDSVAGKMQENKVQFQSAVGADNAWYYFVGTYDGVSQGDIELYTNGVSAGTDTLDVDSPVPWTTDADDDVAFGEMSAKGWYDGLLDEVRISDTNRNGAWIEAGYESAMDDMLDFGSEEEMVLPSISNTPDNYGFGVVAESSTTSTGLTYFTVTNNSGYAVNITIGGTDMTGGTAWTLSDTATPGTDTYGLSAGLDGGSYNIIVRKTGPYNTLKSGLADSGTQKWGFQLLAPDTFSDGGSKSGTVTLTATQA